LKIKEIAAVPKKDSVKQMMEKEAKKRLELDE